MIKAVKWAIVLALGFVALDAIVVVLGEESPEATFTIGGLLLFKALGVATLWAVTLVGKLLYRTGWLPDSVSRMLQEREEI